MVPEGGAPAAFDLRRVGSKQDGGNGGGGGTALLASAGSVPSLGSTTTTEVCGTCWGTPRWVVVCVFGGCGVVCGRARTRDEPRFPCDPR